MSSAAISGAHSGPAMTFHTMGTVASFRSHDAIARKLVPGIEALFAAADQRFSLYRTDSELSRINAGTLRLNASAPEMRDMYALAMSWDHATQGNFTPSAPDGSLDLNGVVKAHALAQAAHLLCSAGAVDWCLNVGGDIVSHGRQHDQTPWTVGITDPSTPGLLLASITTTPVRSAIATSGTDQRGNHIWKLAPAEQSCRPELIQATVAARDIVTADVLATAVIAAGAAAVHRYAAEYDVDIIAVDSLGAVVTSGAPKGGAHFVQDAHVLALK